MSRDEKQNACYLHACLKRMNKEYMTNTSLRERFNVDKKNRAMITRLLNDTCKAGLIKPADIHASGKDRKYIPFWG